MILLNSEERMKKEEYTTPFSDESELYIVISQKLRDYRMKNL